MNKTLIATATLLAVTLAGTACQRGGDACIELDKTSVTTSETVTATNCGGLLPEQYAEPEIDWGDGIITSGQEGSHSYDEAGTYAVLLLINGDRAADASGADPEDVEHEVDVSDP